MYNLLLILISLALCGCIEAVDGPRGTAADDDSTSIEVADLGAEPDVSELVDADGRTEDPLPPALPGPENPHPDGRDPDAGFVPPTDVGVQDTGEDDNGRPL
ncbi:MAG: hypothetical protein R3E66_10615 [bacterium]